MKPLYRGLAVAAVHCLIAFSIAGKYAVDRSRLPRAWTLATPYDPDLPLRGRYVRLQLSTDLSPGGTCSEAVRLSVVNGRLHATADPSGTERVRCTQPSSAMLFEPVAFFIPEHVPDPSRRAQGEELWVEVSVPPTGSPRPIQLGVKKGNGPIEPLGLR